MLNASKYVRNAYKTALTGLTFNGNSVPILESIITVTMPPNYVEITNVTESNVDNDNKFIREVSVDIEVVTKQYKIQSNDLTDDLAELVINAIIPTIGGNMDSAAFQIGHISLESSRYLHEVDEQGNYINRKLLTFRQLVTQKSN